MTPVRALLLAFLAPGCDGTPSVPVTDLESVVSEVVPTVVTVTWATSEAVVARVEYGPSEDLGIATPWEEEATTSHHAVLVGLPAATECAFRVVHDVDGEEQVSDRFAVTTGALGAELPTLTVTGGNNDTWHWVPFLGGAYGPALLDPEGRVTWWLPENSGLDVYRVRPALDGASIFFNAGSVSGDPADDSALVRVSFDGTRVERIPVPLLAHDFVEMDDGTLAAIVVEYRDFEGEPLRGDSIVEIAPDGTQTVVWSAWDCWDPAEVKGTDPQYGWTFANALDWAPDEDAYYLGSRNFSSIVRIDRASGACDWALGGVVGTVDIAAGSGRFLHQHQFEFTEDGVLVFDNDGGGSASRVLEYRFDADRTTATETWRYTDPDLHTFVLGEPRRLEGGDTIVDWSVGGRIERVDPAGVSTWRVSTELGYAFGFDTVLSSPFHQP
ncbi:MAG: aryl-sulfate sulfotransferase [Deltaproteobacteria bacterium]|nr:aryl-sulfate sulfotransferase [Deltaproteobacteria bacterium]